jgi:hypothetical protein
MREVGLEKAAATTTTAAWKHACFHAAVAFE